MIELYKYIIKNRELIEISKRLPILLDQDKKPAAAYDEDNKKIIFKAIDEDEISAFTVVYPPFAKDPVVKEFLKQLEIEEPWLKNEIELHILPAMSEGKIFDASKFFGRIVKYYSKLLGAEKKYILMTFINVDVSFGKIILEGLRTYFRQKYISIVIAWKSILVA